MAAITAGRIALLNPLTTIGTTLAAGTYDGTDATSYTSTSFTPTAGSGLVIFTAESIATGYAPRTSLADGIARTIDWYRRASMGPTVTASGPIP